MSATPTHITLSGMNWLRSEFPRVIEVENALRTRNRDQVVSWAVVNPHHLAKSLSEADFYLVRAQRINLIYVSKSCANEEFFAVIRVSPAPYTLACWLVDQDRIYSKPSRVSFDLKVPTSQIFTVESCDPLKNS